MKICLPKILITGSHGQIGNALQQHKLHHRFQLIGCPKQVLDITQPDSIRRALDLHRPDYIINTAAYTAVDNAESESEKAMEINAAGTSQLALIANQHSIPLIHLSTDYVFSGEQQHAYTETDMPLPINTYGKSKYLGEEAIRKHHQHAIILRVSAVFSEHQHNFLKTIVRLATEKDTLTIVDDQTTRPTYAGHIADVIFKMIDQRVFAGIYHYADAPAITWHGFALQIIEEARKVMPLRVQSVRAIQSKDYPTAAARPKYAVLETTHIEKTLGMTSYHWQEGITSAIHALCTKENTP